MVCGGGGIRGDKTANKFRHKELILVVIRRMGLRNQDSGYKIVKVFFLSKLR